MPDYMLLEGDCLESLKTLADNSVDAVVTDPPYHLTNRTPDVKWCVECERVLGGRDGKPDACPKCGGALEYQRSQGSRGFMGKSWDGGDIAFRPELWSEVLRVLKPGGHLASFSSTRTYHRMACAIEDAGFEVRDQLAWCYGSGFPKSRSMLDIGRPELGTALKPAWEPICLARKPLSEKTVAANVLRWGTGAINIDACKIEGGERPHRVSHSDAGNGIYGQGIHGSHAEGTTSAGRFPANLCHDGSDEVLDLFPESKNGRFPGKQTTGWVSGSEGYGVRSEADMADSGSAARFFYCAKASRHDRAGSKHPTVKPVKLMQWLCRLITPPGGTILDPFAGSGTTGLAARLEGFRSILCEREAEYIADIRNRMDERAGLMVAAE